ncbi:MAG: hypothetical protein CVV44_14005 [Spirochaetae bacterium HGW-Spirochaetae-1]|jgi:predicted Fe-Mo cluster-binding NifX family protein|nr:MAG: hypothetical protein CVV44_14005 [Spirochaetae bacterium HGW-Spirochaetae-1]
MDTEKIAIPVFTGRISPLFDVAKEFHIFSVRNGEIVNSYSVNTAGCSELSIVGKLRQEEASVIICSAISRCTADTVVAGGINLIPGVIGCVDEVIKAYTENSLVVERFAMPGCQGRGRGRRRALGQCPFYNGSNDENDIKRR